MPTPRELIKAHIVRYEGPVSKGPYSDGYMQWLDWDPGNWVTMPDGTQQCIGTNYGVTPNVLAAHRGVKPWSITRAAMKALTLDEATDIGEMRFWRGTGIDQLPWGPATDVLVDIGWGSGPRQAILFAQRLAGVNADGKVGPLTIAAYSKWVASIGWERACRELHRVRVAFYEALGRQNPAKYGPPQRAWRERADGFLPDKAPDGTKWWAIWRSDMPAAPVVPEAMPLPAPAEVQPPAPVAPDKPEGSDLNKTLAGAGGATGVVVAIAPSLLSADWKVVAIVVGAVVVGGIAGLIIWRLRRQDKHAAAGVGG